MAGFLNKVGPLEPLPNIDGFEAPTVFKGIAPLLGAKRGFLVVVMLAVTPLAEAAALSTPSDSI